ncbi:MAG TPA: hypothetical protein VGS62_03715 [Streptosporangiaceae bacterium]|nr:hypothetical protein [Streptosporangiaceae bacterium]
MFVSGQVPVEAGFEVARVRLAKLGSWLVGASNEAYSEEVAILLRVGPAGAVPGLSRLAEIRLRDLTNDSRAGLALRWEVRGPGGRLFPVLDADVTLAPDGEDSALLVLEGSYRPPGGALGAGLDRVLLHRVASATVRNFLGRVAGVLASPLAGAA